MSIFWPPRSWDWKRVKAERRLTWAPRIFTRTPSLSTPRTIDSDFPLPRDSLESFLTQWRLWEFRILSVQTLERFQANAKKSGDAQNYSRMIWRCVFHTGLEWKSISECTGFKLNLILHQWGMISWTIRSVCQILEMKVNTTEAQLNVSMLVICYYYFRSMSIRYKTNVLTSVKIQYSEFKFHIISTYFSCDVH